MVDSAEASGYTFPVFHVQEYLPWYNNLRNIFTLNISTESENMKNYLKTNFDNIYNFYLHMLYVSAKIIPNIDNNIYLADIIDILNNNRVDYLINISKTGLFLKISLDKDDIKSRKYNELVQKAFNLEELFNISSLKDPNSAILNPFITNDDSYAKIFNNIDIEDMLRNLADNTNLVNDENIQNIFALGYLDVLQNYNRITVIFDRILSVYYDPNSSEFRNMNVRDFLYVYSMNNAAKLLVSGEISISGAKIKQINEFISISNQIENYLKDYISVYKYFQVNYDEIVDVVPTYLRGFLL